MATPPVRWRLGCWGWIMLGLGLFGVILITLMLWLRTTSDLDAEIARAAKLGLPMTWAELGLDRPAGPDAEILKEAGQLADRAKSYDGPGYDTLYAPFCPVPPELVAWQRAGGSGIDAGLDRLIDRLSGTTTLGVDAAQLAQALAQRNARSFLHADRRFEVAELFRTRSVAGVDDPRLLAERIARSAMAVISVDRISVLVAQRLLLTWSNHVLRHRDRLDANAMAGQARQLAGQLAAAMPRIVASQPLILDGMLRLPADSVFRAMSFALPALMANRPGMDFFFRCGRAPIVARAIDTAAWCRSHGLPSSCAQVLQAAPALPPRSLWSIPRDLLGMTMDGAYCGCAAHPAPVPIMHYLLMEHLKVSTRLHLVAADLDGSAWPVDPGDPAGGRLREIRRDGRLIGAYAVGPDGRDDGGDKRNDWCWPLREELGNPKASDPPPKR